MSSPHFTGDCSAHHDLVVDFQGPRPPIVALCGSTRFRDVFTQVTRELTMQGVIVVAPGVFGHSGDPLTKDDSARLAELHRRKIDLADEVLVVSDESGYFGEATRSEIEYARTLGKPVRFLTPPASADEWRHVTGTAGAA